MHAAYPSGRLAVSGRRRDSSGPFNDMPSSNQMNLLIVNPALPSIRPIKARLIPRCFYAIEFMNDTSAISISKQQLPVCGTAWINGHGGLHRLSFLLRSRTVAPAISLPCRWPNLPWVARHVTQRCNSTLRKACHIMRYGDTQFTMFSRRRTGLHHSVPR